MKKDYSKYSLEDLIEDENFISWVLGKDEDFDAWHTTKCVNKDEVAQAKSLVEALHSTKEEIPNSRTSVLWDSIDEKIIAQEAPKKIFPLWKKLAVAASFLIILSSSLLLVPAEVNTSISENDIYEHTDGTIITLNESSHLSHPRIKSSSKRTFKLIGEAFFDVTKGDKFLVKTDFAEVEVLGTSFNIYSRNDSLVVSCYSGRVAVRSSGSEVILTPGQEVRCSRADSSLKQYTNNEIIPAWMQNELSASGLTLEEIFKDLEDMFDVKIESDPSIASERFSGKFTMKSIDHALDIICATKNLEYTKKEERFYITRVNK